jgi:hypothetical protein
LGEVSLRAYTVQQCGLYIKCSLRCEEKWTCAGQQRIAKIFASLAQGTSDSSDFSLNMFSYMLDRNEVNIRGNNNSIAFILGTQGGADRKVC